MEPDYDWDKLSFEEYYSPLFTPDTPTGVTLNTYYIDETIKANREYISKTQYDLLLLQVSKLRKRVEEVEERERTLIKMLMEKINDFDS